MSGVLEICFNGTGSPASPSATAAQELCNANLYDPYDKHFEELLYRCLANAPLEALEQIDLVRFVYPKSVCKVHGQDGAITAEQWFWFEVVVNSMTDLVFHVPIVTEVEKLRSARVPPSLFVYTYNATLAAPSWNQNQHELPWLFGDLNKIGRESPGYQKVLLFFSKNGQLGNFGTTGPKREFDCGKTSVDPTFWNFGPRNLKIHQGVDSKDSSYPYFVRVEHVDE
ncbi:unnamed protein product, partial [Mesorhabditis belari]|uniref:Uncharacterized protein n=1 Tax=Mesorhabditis belari TaxID=2138241 RepID=A0AAF3F8F0_9BILA